MYLQIAIQRKTKRTQVHNEILLNKWWGQTVDVMNERVTFGTLAKNATR